MVDPTGVTIQNTIDTINETHDPSLTSWVESANHADTDFPIQNLPFACARPRGSSEAFRGVVAIGDQAVDLAALAAAGYYSGPVQQGLEACIRPGLNAFMALGKEIWSALRLALFQALRTGSKHQQLLAGCLLDQADIEFRLPCDIGDYTDFYCSIHHATSVGSLFRPDNPLLPNYKWLPIGYHGRCSSIGVSGQSFHRPLGQVKVPDAEAPALKPCARLDYELEVGIFIGPENPLGSSLTMAQAEDHIFGLCLLNDWSARDVQAWEYQPLGPFLAKSFASTISPWIVTTEALAPYRVAWSRDKDDPQPLAYLDSVLNRRAGGVDMQLQVLIETQQMRERGEQPAAVSQTNFRHCYWSVAQMVAHHSIGGCNLQPGDLLGSGTQSGPTPAEAGSLLELSQGGRQQITLDNGEQRSFLADGDAVILRGWCQKDGAARIGFGECRGLVLPALS
ncbi:MAG: fumarylacetoacetase [Motiliproteus sp.]